MNNSKQLVIRLTKIPVLQWLALVEIVKVNDEKESKVKEKEQLIVPCKKIKHFKVKTYLNDFQKLKFKYFKLKCDENEKIDGEKVIEQRFCYILKISGKCQTQ